MRKLLVAYMKLINMPFRKLIPHLAEKEWFMASQEIFDERKIEIHLRFTSDGSNEETELLLHNKV